MMRSNVISLSDFKLRIFVDTNVLIDYIEKFDKKGCVAFLNHFKKATNGKKTEIENVELVTSDYVLWEFYGHTREELYAKFLVRKGYGLISANKQSRNGFHLIERTSLNRFAKKILNYIRKIEEEDSIIYIDRLIGKKNDGFSETIDKILQSSKFTYKDAIVLTSAFFTTANIIVSCDEQHFGRHLEEVREALKTWPINPGQIEYYKPEDFSTIEKINSEFEKWFIKKNESKIAGDIVRYYPTPNVVHIKARKKNYFNENDHIYLVKFFNKKLYKYFFKIPNIASGNFKNASNKNLPLRDRTDITIKLPSNFKYREKKWDDGWVFFSE